MIKPFISLFIILLFSSCQTNKNQKDTGNSYTFFLGTYTDLESQGIYKYAIDETGKLEKIGLLAKTENPSFLAKSADNQYLLAVNETNQNGSGSIESYRITTDSLEFINRSSSGGAHPCFIRSNSLGYVVVANYTGGNIGLLKLNSKGQLSALLDLEQHVGSGTTDRQQEPHAHSAWFVDETKVISLDLGSNELWFSEIDTAQQRLLPMKPQKLQMEIGAGPRHLTFHPNGKWFYVLNELNNTITVVKKDVKGNYKLENSISTLPENVQEANTAADIHMSSDGKFLYASNRGDNSIAIFAVNTENGSLNLIAHVETRGIGPRNFSLSPDENFLLVANQYSNNVVSFKRDKKTGLLNFADQIKAFSPVCIFF